MEYASKQLCDRGMKKMTEVTATEKKKYGYAYRKGEEIKVYFLDGKALKGKLLKVYQYEIILEVDIQGELKEVTVLKGAVKYIV